MTTPQEAAWAGEFGDAYTRRNRVNWRARIPFWGAILDKTGARSVFELGCNAGWNLSAIRACRSQVATYGIDINHDAVCQAQAAGLEVYLAGSLAPAAVNPCELAFTSGVLIHVPPAVLEDQMKEMIACSSDYVLAIEYASLSGLEEGVEYRGQADMLWRRDFGGLYQNLGLELIETGPAEGWDRCTYWLLRRKP